MSVLIKSGCGVQRATCKSEAHSVIRRLVQSILYKNQPRLRLSLALATHYFYDLVLAVSLDMERKAMIVKQFSIVSLAKEKWTWFLPIGIVI